MNRICPFCEHLRRKPLIFQWPTALLQKIQATWNSAILRHEFTQVYQQNVRKDLHFPGFHDKILDANLRREVKNLPNIKSAIKRVKVTQKKNLRNRMIKSAMKTQVKKFETAVSANEADVKLLSATQGAVDKAAAKGVIHKNAANRKKARMAKRLAKAAE